MSNEINLILKANMSFWGKRDKGKKLLEIMIVFAIIGLIVAFKFPK